MAARHPALVRAYLSLVSVWLLSHVFLMSMSHLSHIPDTIIEGTITGVAAAVVIAIWSEVSKSIRDKLLERKLRKGVERFGIGDGIYGLSISINNVTDVGIKVRGVGILGRKATYVLNAEGEISNIWTDKTPKIGDKYAEIKIGSIFRKNADEEYPDIPAHSARSFLLHPNAFVGERIDPSSIVVVVEFPVSNNRTKIIRVESLDSSYDILSNTAERLEKAIETGELDNARKLFGLPPVRKQK